MVFACILAAVYLHAKYMAPATTEGPKRVWGNSAPHNFEDFFLNMGDVLVKSGDWRTGHEIHANAKLSPTCAAWKFQDTLETRTRDAESNVASFNAASQSKDARRMMNATTFSCMARHPN